MDSRKLALLCRKAAEDKKADDVLVLDVRGISSITDYFVVATGSSEPHLRAIVDSIEEKVKSEAGQSPRAKDGSLETAWVVLDYFDVIIHVMRKDVREHYKLEDLWGDAPKVRRSVARKRPDSKAKAETNA